MPDITVKNKMHNAYSMSCLDNSLSLHKCTALLVGQKVRSHYCCENTEFFPAKIFFLRSRIDIYAYCCWLPQNLLAPLPLICQMAFRTSAWGKDVCCRPTVIGKKLRVRMKNRQNVLHKVSSCLQYAYRYWMSNVWNEKINQYPQVLYPKMHSTKLENKTVVLYTADEKSMSKCADYICLMVGGGGGTVTSNLHNKSDGRSDSCVPE